MSPGTQTTFVWTPPFYSSSAQCLFSFFFFFAGYEAGYFF